MTKPKDQVEFTLHERMFDSGRLQDILLDVFGLNLCDVSVHMAQLPELDHKRGVRIRCRPSQFALFLIKRNDAGLCNEFKAIYPKLVTPETRITFIDVSHKFS